MSAWDDLVEGQLAEHPPRGSVVVKGCFIEYAPRRFLRAAVVAEVMWTPEGAWLFLTTRDADDAPERIVTRLPLATVLDALNLALSNEGAQR